MHWRMWHKIEGAETYVTLRNLARVAKALRVETPRQLIGEERVPIPVEPGQRARYDYEYVRNGTANQPWRHAKVTEQRTGADFADCMRDLVDEHYPGAERIRVVLDNLSTHTPARSTCASIPPRLDVS